MVVQGPSSYCEKGSNKRNTHFQSSISSWVYFHQFFSTKDLEHLILNELHEKSENPVRLQDGNLNSLRWGTEEEFTSPTLIDKRLSERRRNSSPLRFWSIAMFTVPLKLFEERSRKYECRSSKIEIGICPCNLLLFKRHKEGLRKLTGGASRTDPNFILSKLGNVNKEEGIWPEILLLLRSKSARRVKFFNEKIWPLKLLYERSKK